MHACEPISKAALAFQIWLLDAESGTCSRQKVEFAVIVCVSKCCDLAMTPRYWYHGLPAPEVF